eukprot:5937789-Amphidinium_carterae.1
MASWTLCWASWVMMSLLLLTNEVTCGSGWKSLQHPAQKDIANSPQHGVPFALMTSNVTSWGSLQVAIQDTKASVVYIQEHHLLHGKVADFQTLVERQGWKS